MAELKTKLTNAGVDKFINAIQDPQARADCHQIVELMKKVTRTEPKT